MKRQLTILAAVATLVPVGAAQAAFAPHPRTWSAADPKRPNPPRWVLRDADRPLPRGFLRDAPRGWLLGAPRMFPVGWSGSLRVDPSHLQGRLRSASAAR